ncbi:uncharacterized protein PHACADRAFT_200106 [Phanerochaete carnosa HHB-10118-sp]|uniref:Uncharacterized protein n=1 Tax=Phanerochaete carnosa (strain HHB-10118-sp) TaxID=650164 RepID=K5UNI6_PHACS|nr:uncharacterized protein PHACADRAFT_200106 [Phanerochaete carnosa HHB-10118-sp]EKM51286.1 hypothetical protein PHACADRAFT_200106 [Phanerochaete carnosa HHB-10118-sp]
MALPLPKADFIGTLFELLLYGMYFVSFCQFLRVLYVRHQAGRPILLFLTVALVIISLVTAHLVMQILRILQAFTDHMDVANAPVTYYFITLSTPAKTSKTAIYMTLTLVCDALLVYRVFVVCGRKYPPIVIPSMLLSAAIALFAWNLWAQLNSPQSVDGATARLDYFCAITLALNVLCTVMISWKIWAVHKKLPGPTVAGIRIRGVIVVIIESAMYSFVLIAILVTSTLGAFGAFIVLDSICPIIGIIFSAVIVRASREYHTDTFVTGDTPLQMPSETDQTHSNHSETVATYREVLQCLAVSYQRQIVLGTQDFASGNGEREEKSQLGTESQRGIAVCS